LTTIRRAALALLTRREHSEHELNQKLLDKEFNNTEIAEVIARLKQEGLVSDARFVEAFIHYKRGRGLGPLRIRLELIQRGIAEDLIEEELKIADNSWLIDARHVWRKRFKNRLPHDAKSRAQQMRFLHYRGFTIEHINRIFHSDE
jgi:regulatory protein